MFGIQSITRNVHTTDLVFEDGTRANQFLLDWLYRDEDGQLYTSASGRFTELEGFVTTLERSIDLALERSEMTYADGTCLHTKEGGVIVKWLYEPGLEEKMEESKRSWDLRKAGMFARAAQGKMVREAIASLDALEDA